MAPTKRIVRKKPLRERISAWFNVMDLLLWASEEIETREWDSSAIGFRAGLAFNFLFLLARGNSSADSHQEDDLFSDAPSSGWFNYLVWVIVWSLTTISLANAAYTYVRARHYRLFEVSVENGLDTPSAQRVRVQSSPLSNSPFRFIANMMTPDTAESRAHPDKCRDVWELAVWDPLPVNLTLLCMFSPGHVLIYWMFLPLVPLDPRPSVTIFKCVVLQLVMTAQLFVLQGKYARQAKDNAIVQREVMHEYNTKFVQPRLHPVVRDVGTQLARTKDGKRIEYVDIGTATTQVTTRAFQTHPNPNYVRHISPDDASTHTTNSMNPKLLSSSPSASPAHKALNPFANTKTPALRRSMPASAASSYRQTPNGAMTDARTTAVSTSSDIMASSITTEPPSASATPNKNTPSIGGYMGAYTHHQSPLRKATSLSDLNQTPGTPRTNREMAAWEQRQALERSARPKSRHSSPSKSNPFGVNDPYAAQPIHRRPKERYPSRW